MKRSLRALVPRFLLRWLIEPEVDARVQARTAELAASVDLYRRLVEDSAEGILIHQDGVDPVRQPGGDWAGRRQ